jgi:hypothetical protein
MKIKINQIKKFSKPYILSKLQKFITIYKKNKKDCILSWLPCFPLRQPTWFPTWFLSQNMGDHHKLFNIGPRAYVTSMSLSHPCFVILTHRQFHLW